MKYFAIVLAVIFGIGVLIYVIPQSRAQAWELISYSACNTPIPYKIGTIDGRFGLNHDTAAEDIILAENIWEKEAGKNLFQNTPGAELTINFTYDERQALSTKINNLNSEVSQKNTELKTAIDQFKKDSQDFERRLAEFVATVEKYNSEGGASEENYDKLIQQQEQLKSESDTLNTRARQLNISRNDFNTEVSVLNQDINAFNKALEVKPEEGLYDGEANTITIYFADEKAKLIHTLAHEFGHVMGMEHVKNSDAIMYPSTTPTLFLTEEDISLLEYACRKQSRFKKLLIDFNEWFYEKVEGLA